MTFPYYRYIDTQNALVLWTCAATNTHKDTQSALSPPSEAGGEGLTLSQGPFTRIRDSLKPHTPQPHFFENAACPYSCKRRNRAFFLDTLMSHL